MRLCYSEGKKGVVRKLNVERYVFVELFMAENSFEKIIIRTSPHRIA